MTAKNFVHTVAVASSLALLPWNPVVALGLGALDALLRWQDGRAQSGLWQARGRRVLIVSVLGFTCIGLVAQPLSARRVADIASDEPALMKARAISGSRVEDANLISNRDLSWLVGYSSLGGYGPYAKYVGDGFWRLDAVDEGSGIRYSELVTAAEVKLSPMTPYVLSVEVRHDGDFTATLMFRTRTERWRSETIVERLADGWVRLSAVLPPRAGQERLRILHLADLEGDFSYVEVGRAQLVPGDVPVPFATHSSIYPITHGLRWWGFLGLLLLGVALWALSPEPRWWEAAAAIGCMIAVASQAILGATQVLAGTHRATGTLGDPNIYAHVGVITALASVALARRRLVTAVAGASAAVVVVVSGSLGGAVGLLFSAIGFIVFTSAGRLRWSALAVASLVVAAFGVVLASGTPPWHDDNIVARLQAWRTALKLIAEFPVTGVGHANFQFFHEYLAPFGEGPQFRATHAHSLLHLGAENGVPVLAAFVLGVTVTIVRATRARPQASLVMWTALLLNLTDTTFFNAAFLVPVWLVIAPAAAGQPTTGSLAASSKRMADERRFSH